MLSNTSTVTSIKSFKSLFGIALNWDEGCLNEFVHLVYVEIWRICIEPTVLWTAVGAVNSSQSSSTLKSCFFANKNSFKTRFTGCLGGFGGVSSSALLRSVIFIRRVYCRRLIKFMKLWNSTATEEIHSCFAFWQQKLWQAFRWL